MGTAESLSSSRSVKVKSLYVLIYMEVSRMEEAHACIPPVNFSSDVFKGCKSSGIAYPVSQRSYNTTSIHIRSPQPVRVIQFYRCREELGLKYPSKEPIYLTDQCIFAEIQTTLKLRLHEGCHSIMYVCGQILSPWSGHSPVALRVEAKIAYLVVARLTARKVGFSSVKVTVDCCGSSGLHCTWVCDAPRQNQQQVGWEKFT